MDFKQTNVIKVYYYRGNHSIPMGKLAINNRKIFFEYFANFLELGLELSPFKLPLKPGLITCNDTVFDGLFGIFNDSLPDGWGRLLLDRKLLSKGINPHNLTPLDRLCYVGNRGMGALLYKPEINDDTEIENIKDLDIIANECLQIDNDNESFIDELLTMNGSSAGARPKILVSLVKNKNKFTITPNNPFTNQNNWIIKFRSALDPLDIGAMEYAYHLMALAAGLDVPEARLFKSKKCPGYFGVKRFDRQKLICQHMHTLSGLLQIDYRIPSLDYEALMKATMWLTKNIQECEKQFRHAVFNVLAHNRDDHPKNFSFLMDEHGVWRVSPAYDLTFSAGPMGEHHTTIMGEGKNPTTAHLIKLAETVSLEKQKTLYIIEEVKQAIANWNQFAKQAHVSPRLSKTIQLALTAIN